MTLLITGLRFNKRTGAGASSEEFRVVKKSELCYAKNRTVIWGATDRGKFCSYGPSLKSCQIIVPKSRTESSIVFMELPAGSMVSSSSLSDHTFRCSLQSEALWANIKG